MTENTMERRTNPPTRFLRLPEVMERTGLSRSTIYVRLAEGRFPRPVALGGRAVGWIEAEVDEWVRERHRREPVEASGPVSAARPRGVPGPSPGGTGRPGSMSGAHSRWPGTARRTRLRPVEPAHPLGPRFACPRQGCEGLAPSTPRPR